MVGAAAGLAAGLVMNPSHRVLSAILRAIGWREPEPSGPPATVKAVEALVGPIDERDRGRASSLAHYTMAAMTGAAYALASPALPVTTLGRGAAYGAAVWLVADETAVPLLGLSEPPWRVAGATHARALGAHLVYGAALDACVRLARAVTR
jgi:hypothetical protein